MTPLELLAPARNADIGIAAIRCGADAVYIGGPAFGARAAAGNSVEDIKRLCDYASLYGVRIFVTVNTLCRSGQERQELVRLMLRLKDTGVSAFIIQDTTLLPLLRPYGEWKEEFHASTQCAIRTPERARFLASLGFSRLVLERELSLAQIRGIRDAVPGTDLEFFVHGALCVCYSGDCYLSEALTGRSANRGECAQPCRSDFDLVDASGRVLCASKALMSLKDYCLIDRLEELAQAGIVSFKIEGRLKNESYVKNVVRAYSQRLDSIVERSAGAYCRSSCGRTDGGFRPDLRKTFNRGYTELYLDGKRGSWHTEDAAKHMGEAVGCVSGVGGRRYIDVAPAGNVVLNNGDGLCVVRPDGGVEGFRADRVEGRRVYCKVPDFLRKNARLWRNRDAAFEKQLENTPDRTLEVRFSLVFTPGKLRVDAVREDGSVLSCEYDTGAFDTASNRSRMESLVRTQLSKGAGAFRFAVCSVECSGDMPLVSAAYLNNIRREFAGRFSAVAAVPRKAESRAAALPDAPGNPSLEHPRRQGELMRTKYCIKHRMGLCGSAERLFLRNNGKTVPLVFDCRSCEMILGSDIRG